MFARIGIMRALNRGHVREFDSTRKNHHWGKAEAETRYVMNDEKDAFDLWWEWADKPVDNKPTIDAAVWRLVRSLRGEQPVWQLMPCVLEKNSDSGEVG